jgi:hypothetical protein
VIREGDILVDRSTAIGRTCIVEVILPSLQETSLLIGDTRKTQPEIVLIYAAAAPLILSASHAAGRGKQ